MDRFEELFSKYDFSNLDFESVSNKAHQLVKDGFERNNDKAIYSKLLSFIDITSLNFGDSYDSIISFVNKINAFDDHFEILPHPAAICVFPAFVPIVKFLLGVSQVSVPYSTLFVLIPLVRGVLTRLLVINKKGLDYFENNFIHKFDNATTLGLLLTSIMIFSSHPTLFSL